MENEEKSKRLELKVTALLQKISKLTTEYENQDAERRVEYTLLEEQYHQVLTEREELFNEVSSLRQRLEELTNEVSEDVPQEEATEPSNDTD